MAKFIFTVVSDIFSIIISVLLFPPTYKTVCKFMYTEKNVPGSGEVYRSLEKCGSSVWNFMTLFWCQEFRGGSSSFHLCSSMYLVAWFCLRIIISEAVDVLNVLRVGYVLRIVSIGFCGLYLMYNLTFTGLLSCMLKQFHCFYVHYCTIFRVCGSDVGLLLESGCMGLWLSTSLPQLC